MSMSRAGRRHDIPGVPPLERIDVLGVTDYTFRLTAHAKARGWDAAFGPGVLRLQGQCGRGKTPSTSPASGEGVLSVKEGQSGRGERISPDTPSPILLILVTNVPSYVHQATEIA